jgi:hypothetical protein
LFRTPSPIQIFSPSHAAETTKKPITNPEKATQAYLSYGLFPQFILIQPWWFLPGVSNPRGTPNSPIFSDFPLNKPPARKTLLVDD